MKKLLFLFLALPLFSIAQTSTFNIKGHVGNLNSPARIYLFYQLGANKVADSSALVNGDFTFTGQLLNPTNAYLVTDYKGQGLNKLTVNLDMLSFFVEKGDMSITSATDSIAKATITGSVINDDNIKLMAQITPIMTDVSKLTAEVQATPKDKQNTDAFQIEVQDKFKALQNRQRSVLQTFIIAHPASYLSLIALNSIDNKTDPFEAERLYNTLTPEVKETEAGKVIKQSIDQAKITAIGAIAPDFTQKNINDIPIKLSSFRGKYVLIDFWASWCGPCRDENPNLVKNYNKYKDKKFTILGVSLDRPGAKADWLAAIKRDGLAWPQVTDLKFWNSEVAELYAVTAIPANFLIDPFGKIIARDLRGADLDKKLAEVLGK
ncbi:MAG: TlpA disulfide reductase family protein [Mucilaginibacter sp.]